MQTEILNVKGMTCGGCTSTVMRALKAVPGVGETTVSLEKGEVTVQYDEKLATLHQLKTAVQDAGYSVDETIPTDVKKSKGGCC
jgi:copper chaperone CopZ